MAVISRSCSPPAKSGYALRVQEVIVAVIGQSLCPGDLPASNSRAPEAPPRQSRRLSRQLRRRPLSVRRLRRERFFFDVSEHR